jgi:hypothetical protein
MGAPLLLEPQATIKVTGAPIKSTDRRSETERAIQGSRPRINPHRTTRHCFVAGRHFHREKKMGPGRASLAGMAPGPRVEPTVLEVSVVRREDVRLGADWS